jgi:protein phosphatase PTC1
MSDPQVASQKLVEHALGRFSTDNLSCMVVRFDGKALKSKKVGHSIGVEGDEKTKKGGMSEADKLVEKARKSLDEEHEKEHSEEDDEAEGVTGKEKHGKS